MGVAVVAIMVPQRPMKKQLIELGRRGLLFAFGGTLFYNMAVHC